MHCHLRLKTKQLHIQTNRRFLADCACELHSSTHHFQTARFFSTGNVYKMSRNKDRYESNNQRRQQIFMSQEDVAAGRKSNWTGVEITGNYSAPHCGCCCMHARAQLLSYPQAMYEM